MSESKNFMESRWGTLIWFIIFFLFLSSLSFGVYRLYRVSWPAADFAMGDSVIIIETDEEGIIVGKMYYRSDGHWKYNVRKKDGKPYNSHKYYPHYPKFMLKKARP